MYAIVATGGKQLRVQAGQIINIETLDAKVGDVVKFDQILAIGGEGVDPVIGKPLVSGATVTGRVISEGRAPKIIVFKKMRRSQYKRRNGHRQNFLAVRFEEITCGGKSVKAEPMKEKAPKAEAKPAGAKTAKKGAAKAAPAKKTAKKAAAKKK